MMTPDAGSQTRISTWSSRRGREVCICGIGARTAVGRGAQASAAAVRASISGLVSHPSFTDQDGEPVSFAADSALSPELSLIERMRAMLSSAADEAFEWLGQTPRMGGIWLAVGEPRSGLPSDIGEQLSGCIGDPGGTSVHVMPCGHAGGLMAMQAAAQEIGNGSMDTALVAGVDSYHHPLTIASLDLHRRLMCSRNPSGFPVGEAAGACLLASLDSAHRHGWPILARIRAASTAVERHTFRSNEPCLGEGLTAALLGTAFDMSANHATRFDHSYCDLNGERYRNDEYAYAVMHASDAFRDALDYLSPADCWGDVGAASGPLFAALAISAGLRCWASGPAAALWAGADSGYRSAVALEISLRAPA